MPKKKNKSTKDKSSQTDKKEEQNVNKKAETIQEIYAQGEEIRLPAKGLNWLAIIVLTTAIGIIAGFFGGWWQMKMMPGWMANNDPQTNTPDIANILDLAAEQNKDIKQSFDQITLQNLSNQTVEVYQRLGEQEVDQPLQNIYTQENLLGQALVVTSDGWLVTHSDIVDDANGDYLLITSDRQGHQIDKVIFDEFTNLVFVKIDASNLKPITITDVSQTDWHDDLIVLRNTLRYQQPQIRYVNIIDKDFTDVQTTQDFIYSTQQNQSYIKLNTTVEDIFSGSLLANNQGEVVGLVYTSSQGTGLDMAIPGFYLKVAVTNFLDDQTKVQYNSLGINYIDLSEVVGLPEELHQGYSHGALIYAPAELPAVLDSSAAAQAGLTQGDIILEVNQQQLSSTVDLNKLIQEYPLGSTVTLTILSAQGEQIEEITTLDIIPE